MRIGAPVNVQRNIACVALDWGLVVGDVLMIRLFTELGSLRIGHVDRDGSISTMMARFRRGIGSAIHNVHAADAEWPNDLAIGETIPDHLYIHLTSAGRLNLSRSDTLIVMSAKYAGHYIIRCENRT